MIFLSCFDLVSSFSEMPKNRGAMNDMTPRQFSTLVVSSFRLAESVSGFAEQNPAPVPRVADENSNGSVRAEFYLTRPMWPVVNR